MSLAPTTLLVSHVIISVKRTFGDESAVQVTDEDIFRWVNEAQREILNTNKILKATAVTNIVKDQNAYTFPTQDIQEVQAIHVQGRKMEFYSFQEAEEHISADAISGYDKTTGTPIAWYEWGGTFYLYPTPDTAIANGITIYYVKSPSKVTTTTDPLSVPDSYYNRIVEYCLSQAYELDDDVTSSQFKIAQFVAGLDKQANQESSTYANYYPRITILEDDL